MKFWVRNRLKNPLYIYNNSCFSFNHPIHKNQLAYKPLHDQNMNNRTTIGKTNTLHKSACLELLKTRAK